ncbi:MAG: ribosome maturation factor RimM [Pseudomonadales bacterium]|nr:ribosome maturation factor RimM [Pseudomonadales bacterium]
MSVPVTSAATRQMIVIGRVGAPYGVKGWVRVSTFTDPPENLLDYRPWWLNATSHQDSPPLDPDEGWRKVDVVEARPHQQGFVAHLRGVDDRTAAERMQGVWIGVQADQLAETAEDEYYWRDLVGLTVFNSAGHRLGTVDRLFETGAQDVMVIKGDSGETLIPFHRNFVLEVDLAGNRLLVDWEEM